MRNQEIFEMLANIECELFYKYADMDSKDPAFEEMKKAHEAAKKALEAFASATGCTN